MSEKSALECLDCHFATIVKTPDTQVELVNLISRLRFCPDCGHNRIVQRAYCGENGVIYSGNQF